MEAIMEKKELLYEGKAKKVYTTENPSSALLIHKINRNIYKSHL